MQRLEFNPAVSSALWLALAIAAVGLWTWYAWASRGRMRGSRRALILTGMATLLVLPLLVLLNPTWMQAMPPPPGKPVITVLIDSTGSMGTDDVVGDQSAASTVRTRLARAVEIARQVDQKLGGPFDVRVRRFDEVSRPMALDDLTRLTPRGDVTDLSSGIDDVLAEEQPQGQGVLLLSDGVHNAGPTAMLRQTAARAKAASAPVYTHVLGGVSNLRDLEVSVAATQELAFVGQKIPIHVQIRQRGDLTRKSALSLQVDGQPAEQLDVALSPDATTSADFQVSQDKIGLYRYTVQIAPHPDEVTALNNTATVLVRVIDQPVQALLLEGKPYWDTKFLIRTLGQDPSIALSSVIRIADGRLLERTISAPDAKNPPTEGNAADKLRDEPAKADAAKTDAVKPAVDNPTQPAATRPKITAGTDRAEKWSIVKDAGQWLADPASLSKYQLIILGRESEVFLSDQAITQLKRWLAEGNGSLVCFRGAPSAQLNQRMAALMPVKWAAGRESRFRVRLTSSGHDLQWLPQINEDDDPLSRLPSLATGMTAKARQPLATVLASSVVTEQSADAPVIAYQSVGLGKVVVVEGAGMWRWAFLPRNQEHADDIYPLLWRNLVRWLTSSAALLPSQTMALRADQVSFFTGEPVTATLMIRESALSGEPPQIEIQPEGVSKTPDRPAPGSDQNSAANVTWPRIVKPLPSGDAAGVFRVPLGTLPEGRYQARVAGGGDDPTARLLFEVRGNLRERLDVSARPDLMKLLADESGGAVLGQDTVVDFANQFTSHLAQTRPTRVIRTPAWDRWWLLAALATVWGVTWMLRRSSGLV